MRIGQDLATTNGYAHLNWETDGDIVTLSISRADEGKIFADEGYLGPAAAERALDAMTNLLAREGVKVQPTTMTLAQMVADSLQAVRAWLDAFQKALVNAKARMVAAFAAEGPIDDDVEFYTQILDGGAGTRLGLWLVAGKESLLVSIDIGVSRRRRSALWSQRLAWGAYNGSGRDGITNGGMARAALVAELAAWADTFRLEVLGTADRLGKLLLQATETGGGR